MKIIYLALIVVTGILATYAIDWRPGVDELIIRKYWLILSVCSGISTLAWYLFMKSKGISPYNNDEDGID